MCPCDQADVSIGRAGQIVVDEGSWTSEDMFFAVNFPGKLLLSPKATNIITERGFTNAQVVPCEEYAFSFSP